MSRGWRTRRREDEQGMEDEEGGEERLVKFIVALGTGRQLTHPLTIISEVSSQIPEMLRSFSLDRVQSFQLSLAVLPLAPTL